MVYRLILRSRALFERKLGVAHVMKRLASLRACQRRP